MADARPHHRFQKRAALHRIVKVISEGIGNRFRHNDGPGEMHYRTDLLLGENPGQQVLICNVALVEGHTIGYGEFEAGGQVVDDRHGPAAIAEGQHGMAADVACAAGNQNGEMLTHAKGTWIAMTNQGLAANPGNVRNETAVFPRIARPLALALCLGLIAGCAKPAYVSPVSVTRFTGETSTVLASGTISVEASANTQSDSLEYGLFAAEVAGELEALGYQVVESGADQIAVVSLSQTVGRRQDRGPVSVTGGGVVGSHGSGVGLGLGIDLSGPDPDEIRTLLSVAIRPANGGDNLWEGRASGMATSNSPLSNPAATADRMAEALFSGFPGESGETIEVR